MERWKTSLIKILARLTDNLSQTPAVCEYCEVRNMGFNCEVEFRTRQNRGAILAFLYPRDLLTKFLPASEEFSAKFNRGFFIHIFDSYSIVYDSYY